MLHLRPNATKSVSATKLRDPVLKGAVEAYASHATVADICLAATCALALADGAELPLGDAVRLGGDTAGRLVAARLPTDIFSVLGSIVGDDGSDAESIGTASAVSELLGSDDELHGVSPAAHSRPTIFVCHLSLPFPCVGVPSVAADAFLQPMASKFKSILTALYIDPIRVSSIAR